MPWLVVDNLDATVGVVMAATSIQWHVVCVAGRLGGLSISDVHRVLALAREVEPQHTSNLTQTTHPPPSTTCSDCWQRNGYVQKQRTHRPSAVPLALSGTVTQWYWNLTPWEKKGT
jgi:hypothetical protein